MPEIMELDITKQNIQDWDEFSYLVQKAIQKQESYLLGSIKTNKGLNPTIAIFRLKQPQHGYSDKQEQVITATVQSLPASTSVVDELIEQLKENTKRQALEGEVVPKEPIKQLT